MELFGHVKETHDNVMASCGLSTTEDTSELKNTNNKKDIFDDLLSMENLISKVVHFMDPSLTRNTSF